MRTNYKASTKLFLLFNILICNSSFAQHYFQEIFGKKCYDEGYSICQTNDNSLIMAGYTCSYNGTNDVYLSKVKSNGIYLWSRSINILEHERAYSVIECKNDTGLYVYALTGDTWNDSINGGKRDAFVMLTDVNGFPYWVKRYTRDTTNEYGRSIICTTDSGFVIAGYINSCDSDSVSFCNDVLIIKTDKSGNAQWIDYVDINKGDDFGFKVIEFNRSYYVTGYTRKFNTNDNDIFLMQISPTGAVNWIRAYGDTLDDFAYSLKATSDSSIVIVGHTYNYSVGNGVPDVITIKTDLNGAPRWKAVYNSNPNQQQNFGRDIIESRMSDGTNSYYITGYSDALMSGAYDVQLINTSVNGVMNWQAVYGGNSENRSYALTLTLDSGVAMVGYTDSLFTGSNLLHDKYLVKVTSVGRGCETYLDTNYRYIDSLYESPIYTVVNDSIFTSEHYSYLKPTDHDSLCFDSTGHREYNIFNITEEFGIINLYPNPVSGPNTLNILLGSSKGGYAQYKIFDTLGRIVLRGDIKVVIGINSIPINLNNLPSSIYWIQIGNNIPQKFIKIK